MGRLIALLLLVTCALIRKADAEEAPPPSRPRPAEGITLLSGSAAVSDDGPLIELFPPRPVPPAEITFDESLLESIGTADLAELLDADPPHWANELIDDHALIYRETRSDLEVLGRGAVFGMTSLGFSGGVSGADGPFWFTPKFGWHFLTGPDAPETRPQFYDLALELNFAQSLSETWSLHLQFTPTWASDFDNKDGEALRFLGGGLLSARLSPLWRVVGGVTYLDREDLPWLPIAGIRAATEDVELDLVVPRPRFAVRTGVDEKQSEDWLYVAGEVGGGAWAFEREDSGLHDVFNYRDLRVLVGFESRDPDGSRNVFEVGYVFERQIRFEKGPGSLVPGDTWVLRWGSTY